MTQKAVTGCTSGRASVGYLKVRKRDELRHEIRGVKFDTERATRVKLAFEAYATGGFSIITLREELLDRGLTSVPTPSTQPIAAPCHRCTASCPTSTTKGRSPFREPPTTACTHR